MKTNITLPDLWDFQSESVNRLREEIRKGNRRLVLSSPTGSGKTEIAKYMLGSARLKGSRSLFIVDRLSLLEQTSRRFNEAGIQHGIIGGGMTRGLNSKVVVGMIQSIAKRGEWPKADVVFFDECHTVYSFVREHIHELQCPAIGLTATPLTRSLGRLYDGGVVQVTTTDDLIAQARLAPLVVLSAAEIDMSGAPLVNGEWASAEVERRGNRIVGDIVSCWAEQTAKHFKGPVKTMLFSATIAHGEELCRAFQSSGIEARQVTAYDDIEDRNRTMEDFRAGKFPIIVSVDALAKGVDLPDVQCLIVARPYRKAFAAHIQMLGRVMRASPGKRYALVIDHAGNYLGFLDQTLDFFANGVSSLDDHKFQNVTRQEKPKRESTCPSCNIVMPPASPVCPMCGFERKRRNDIETVPGTLVSVSDDGDRVYQIEPVKKGRVWRGTARQLWKACCAQATPAYFRHGDSMRAERYAKASFHNLTKEWPPRHYYFVEHSYVPKTIERRLAKEYREWKKQRASRDSISSVSAT